VVQLSNVSSIGQEVYPPAEVAVTTFNEVILHYLHDLVLVTPHVTHNITDRDFQRSNVSDPGFLILHSFLLQNFQSLGPTQLASNRTKVPASLDARTFRSLNRTQNGLQPAANP
jgi:hypothetical protein